MKVYSTIIDRHDLYGQLLGIEDVGVDADGVREFTPRRGGNGFELYLEGYGERHRRARNGRDGHAATWDDYGVWIDRLFHLDPNAEIAFYKGRDAFIDSTSRYRATGGKAPWLTEDVGLPYRWPDAAQKASDDALIERVRKVEVRLEARRLRARADRLEASVS